MTGNQKVELWDCQIRDKMVMINSERDLACHINFGKYFLNYRMTSRLEHANAKIVIMYTDIPNRNSGLRHVLTTGYCLFAIFQC